MALVRRKVSEFFVPRKTLLAEVLALVERKVSEFRGIRRKQAEAGGSRRKQVEAGGFFWMTVQGQLFNILE